MFTNSEKLHGISIVFSRFLVKQLWIHNEFAGFTMHGFLDSQWVFLIHEKVFSVQTGSGILAVFWDSRCVFGIHDGLVQLLGGVTKVFKCWYSGPYSNVGAQMSMLGTCFKCLLHVHRESCSCSSSMCSLICIDAWLQTF